VTTDQRVDRWSTPTQPGPPADGPTHAEVSAFLAYEAEALDSHEFARWAELVDDSFTYRVPVPILQDNLSSPGYDTGSLLIDEDKTSIVQLWFGRFGEDIYEFAWGDHPPVRMRHFVTNVRVRTTELPDEFDVRANVRVHMVRQTMQKGELVAERFDRIRRAPAGLRLLSRFAVLDDLVLEAPQLRVIL
jgi:3-phenylpropionate/cinnamic acid dioxygenase small subunit